MNLPEVCYRLTDMDLSGSLADFVSIFASDSAASVSPGKIAFYTVPRGKILLLQSIVVSAIPGAAQLLRDARISFAFNGQVIQVFAENANPAIAAAIAVRMTAPAPEILIPQEFALSLTSTFNAGVAANYIETNITGWLIPRGSVVI